MIDNIIKEVSENNRVPAETSKDYMEYVHTVKECANLDSKIKLVRVDNFAIARNNYGHVKYLDVIWQVDADMLDDLSEEKLFEIQEFIYENLYKNMRSYNSDLNVFVIFDRDEKLEISGDCLITAIVQEIYDWQP
tara:strand:+ start:3796 stop:4200 length:405 start_codon:yes stop_codon:yes gene_type:complete